eukprot:CAMPEP_0170463206 /NCGR_PEP_ID=MMETSP0123-20130129/8411_1 /TAXON_ID=182087 /ORGANISM="Favella ehrenbergii, Strain Fehren 1" /LENGTH=219 /DNA_ID=CAMNT_0010728593 /DNA_START=28 /DNA_END=687 /DNA_ORIENTATION=-
MSKLVSVAAGLALTAEATLRFKGCPDEVKVQETFDADRYSGTWFEIVRDKWTPYELGQTCVTAQYTVREDKSIEVFNSGYTPLLGWGGGTASALQPEGRTDAGLIVNFYEEPKPTDVANYRIIETDYDNYSIVYSCEDIFTDYLSIDFLWILSRERTMDDMTMLGHMDTILKVVPDYGFFENHMVCHQGSYCDTPYETRPQGPIMTTEKEQGDDDKSDK